MQRGTRHKAASRLSLLRPCRGPCRPGLGHRVFPARELFELFQVFAAWSQHICKATADVELLDSTSQKCFTLWKVPASHFFDHAEELADQVSFHAGRSLQFKKRFDSTAGAGLHGGLTFSFFGHLRACTRGLSRVEFN